MTLIACALCAVAVDAGAAGDEQIVRLRTGEVLKGRVVWERSDVDVIALECLPSGALRTISWDAVDPRDVDRLQSAGPVWARAAGERVEGVRFLVRLEDGTQRDVCGLVIREGVDHVEVLSAGKVIRLRKNKVLGRGHESLDPRAVWTPARLLERFLRVLVDAEGARLDDLTTRQRFRIADYARWVGDLETASKHFAVCAEDAAFVGAKTARERLVEINGLRLDKAAVEALRPIRVALWLREFRQARRLMTAFPGSHPKAGEHVRRHLAQLEKDFVAERTAHFRREVAIAFPKILGRQIDAKVREEGITLSDTVAWARRELPDEVFVGLSAQFAKCDDVTAAEARAFWGRRLRAEWTTASYGSGTFIVRPSKAIDPLAGREWEPPKPPTRDRWWHDASAEERAAWITAFFAENAQMFEATTRPAMCTRCKGAGVLDGSYCTGCNGAQTERTVRYR